MNSTANTERTAVKTYIPAYQKEEWAAHADELDMSMSEFIRSMVQAGRKGFDGIREEGGIEASHPRGNSLETRLLTLIDGSAKGFDDLTAEITAGIEHDVENALVSLEAEGMIQQRPRGEYVRSAKGSTDGT